MRLVLSILLAGCAVGDGLVDPSPDDIPQAPLEIQSRFAPGANAHDPGMGVVAAPNVGVTAVPSVWVSMGDVMCIVEGRNGWVTQDTQVPGAGYVVVDVDEEGFLLATGPVLFLVTPDGTSVEQIVPVGPVAAAERLSDGSVAMLVDMDEGCALELDGEVTPLTSVACDPDADIEEAGDRLLISTATEILDDQGAVFAAANQVSVDVGGAIWTGSTAGSHLTGRIGKRTISIDLGDSLIDFEARQGTLIALTDKPSLLRMDATTGEILDEEPYYGVLGGTHLELNENGHAISITGNGRIQFYRVRTDEGMDL